MIVREYTDADFDEIKRLHGQCGFDYKLPSLSSKDFFSRQLITDGEHIGMAAFMRRTAEAYLICDPAWKTPAWRMEALRKLHYVCNSDAAEQDCKDVVVFVPPDMDRFGDRLIELKWDRAREGWTSYSHQVTK